MIDKKGKLFSKISVVDIIVILAICLAVVGFAYKMRSGDSKVSIKSDTAVQVEFKAKTVRDYSVNAAEVGAYLYETKGQKLGKIIKVETKPAHRLINIGDGRQVNAPIDNRYDMYITIEGDGQVDNGGVYINGNKLMLVGSDIKIRTNKLNSEAIISGVRVTEEED